MFFKTCATLAFATGFAAAKPIFTPDAVELPAYRRGTSPAVSKRTFGNNNNNNNIFNQNNNNDFSFIDGFNNFNNQAQVFQLQEENFQIVDNGFQQAVVQQVNEVLVVNQNQNGFNNDLNNLFRKANFQNQFQDVSTVMLVVQEINVAVDDGFGNAFSQNVFAQSAVVANRGQFATQTLMVFAQETLIAQNILANNAFANINNGIGGVGVGGGVGNRINDSVPIPTATAGIQLFGSKPTWSSIAADPAATLGGIWQAELQDAQALENNAADNELNAQAGGQEKQALDKANAQQGQE